jgi:acyl CoA:acetate/3-ketoacid CoA transferase beta subunit
MRYVSSIEEIAVEDKQEEIALKMLEDQVSLETIARYTGLSLERIRELQSRQK